MSARFADFARTCAALAATRGAAQVAVQLRTYLDSLTGEDRAIALSLLAPPSRAQESPRRSRLTPPLLLPLLEDLTGWDTQVLTWVGHAEGDWGATARALWPIRDDAPSLTLEEVSRTLLASHALAGKHRLPLVRQLFHQAGSESACYLIRLLTGGLKCGITADILALAIADEGVHSELPVARHLTLTLVVIAAESDDTARYGPPTSLTVAARQGETFAAIGKVALPLDLPERSLLLDTIRQLTIRRIGPLRLLTPEIVLDVACAGIEPSTRHRSKLALIAPQFLSWQIETLPQAATTLNALRASQHIFPVPIGGSA